MKNTVITLALALVIIDPLSAQSKKGSAAAPQTIDATVDAIHDRRTTTSFSTLDITLKLAGILESDVTAARVTIRKAVDDTGRDLRDPEKGEPRFEQTTGAYFRGNGSSDPASINIGLLNPTREATKVVELAGEVELYMPGKDAGAVVLVPRFQSLAGKPVTNKALKANGVEITVIGPAQLEAEKKKASKAYAAKMKQEGSDDETIKWMVESFESNFATPDESEAVLKVKDPGKKIHELAFVDASGEAQRAYPREADGFTLLSTYGAAPAADWSLKVSLRTPKALAKRSFVVRDIELP